MIPHLLSHVALKNEHLKEFLAEFLGTSLLLTLGGGVSAQHILGDGARHGIHEYGGFLTGSISWGLAVFLGAYVAGKGGAGHINSAVTLGMALMGKIRWSKVPLYLLAQQLGAFMGSILVFGVYYHKLVEYETMKVWETKHATAPVGKEIVNSSEAVHFTMEHTGFIFVTQPNAPPLTCFLDQILVASILVGCAIAITDKRRVAFPDWAQAPMIGLLFTALVNSFALNAGAALNPARDFAPRVMLWLCGWGNAAFSAKHYYFWVPIAGPLLGGFLGAFWYELLIGAHLETSSGTDVPTNKQKNNSHEFQPMITTPTRKIEIIYQLENDQKTIPFHKQHPQRSSPYYTFPS